VLWKRAGRYFGAVVFVFSSSCNLMTNGLFLNIQYALNIELRSSTAAVFALCVRCLESIKLYRSFSVIVYTSHSIVVNTLLSINVALSLMICVRLVFFAINQKKGRRALQRYRNFEKGQFGALHVFVRTNKCID
jgi:hypothetical protein